MIGQELLERLLECDKYLKHKILETDEESIILFKVNDKDIHSFEVTFDEKLKLIDYLERRAIARNFDIKAEITIDSKKWKYVVSSSTFVDNIPLMSQGVGESENKLEALIVAYCDNLDKIEFLKSI